MQFNGLLFGLLLASALTSCAGPIHADQHTSRVGELTGVSPSSASAVVASFDDETECAGICRRTTVGGPHLSTYLFSGSAPGEPAWAEFEVDVKESGRYAVTILNLTAKGEVTLELVEPRASGLQSSVMGPITVDHTISVSGAVQPAFSPLIGTIALCQGSHRMRLACSQPELIVHGVRFDRAPSAEPPNQSMQQVEITEFGDQ